MKKIKKIKLKKENISNLSNSEMTNLKGGAASNPECIILSVGCSQYTCAADPNCQGTGYWCISVAQTSPCHTYPNC